MENRTVFLIGYGTETVSLRNGLVKRYQEVVASTVSKNR